MTDTQKLARALGWEFVNGAASGFSVASTFDLVTYKGSGKAMICCDDSFIRLVEAELEKRGLLDDYCFWVDLWAKERAIIAKSGPNHALRSLITAPTQVKRAAALKVLREE